ncbi:MULTISPECIES: hypothetical protein [unclassified Methanoculleus]|jgi:Flp pilus assembly protein TadB|uniref:hypothetical protein n=1 Tax=unclassified Methanoculleus TaxID=2619537 RepID=UPI0025E0D198|nr:hypothetical protein [Methanoculleus sp. UBA377]
MSLQTSPESRHAPVEPPVLSNVLPARGGHGRPLLAFAAFSALALITAGSVPWYGASALSFAAAPAAGIAVVLYFASVRLKRGR